MNTETRPITSGPLAAQSSVQPPMFVAEGTGVATRTALMDFDDEDSDYLTPLVFPVKDEDHARLSAGARLSGSTRLSGSARRSAPQRKPALVPVGPQGMAQAERGLVGALLVDNSLYDIVAGQLTREDFSDAGAGQVYEAIAEILDGKIDGITVAEPFTVAARKGVSKVAGLHKLQTWCQDAETDQDKISSRARMVHEDAMQRRMVLAVAEAGDLLSQDNSVQERANLLAALLEQGAAEVHKSEIKSAGSFAVAAVTALAEQARQGKTITGLATGFRDLDLLLAGLQPGQLIVVAARPAVGKTAFTLSAMLNMAEQGIPGLFISLEMPGQELAKRTLAHISGVDSHQLRIAALSANEWERVIAAAEHLGSIPLAFNDVTTVSLRALRSMARREHKAGRLKVLAVDYLQIMDADDKLTREQQISTLSRGLKKLGMELGIPVIVLSQLNRDLEKRVNKRPILSDLRESGAIEQDADVIIFIDRDVEGKNPALADKALLIVGKQRSGRIADIQVNFDGATTRFHDADHGE